MVAKWQLVDRRPQLNVCGGVRGRYEGEDRGKRRKGRGRKKGRGRWRWMGESILCS